MATAGTWKVMNVKGSCTNSGQLRPTTVARSGVKRVAAKRFPNKGQQRMVCIKVSEKTNVETAAATSATVQSDQNGAMNKLYNDIFTKSGNEALGFMDEDSAGQSNIFAYEPSKPYESKEGGELGTAAGGIFAVVTVLATFAVGYAGGQLYKDSFVVKQELKPLSFYVSSIEASVPTPAQSFLSMFQETPAPSIEEAPVEAPVVEGIEVETTEFVTES